jgi:HK97 family phage prohead protease
MKVVRMKGSKEMSRIEKRAFALELRVDRGEGDDEGLTLRGHAAVFDSLSEDLGGFREKVEPGAFKKAIKSDDVRALWNHDSNIVLGRNKSGTLSLSEDDTGLAIKIDAPDTQMVRDMVLSPIERGDVDQMSFAFRVKDERWEEPEEEGGLPTRTLLEVSLADVSPVTYPAYADTAVAVRSLEEWKNTHGDEPTETPRLDEAKLKQRGILV